MILHLAERLDIPLRERNRLLLAAGFAPVYPAHPWDDPALDAAREAIDLVLTGHEPYPAIAVDGHWNLIAANRVVEPLLEGADPSLLRPPLNVLRLSLHPDGLAPRIANLAEWRAHLLERVRRQAEVTADPVLSDLLKELRDYPAPAFESSVFADQYGGVVIPLRFGTPMGILSFFSTTTVFGTPRDITLSEIALESFFPADPETAAALQKMARR
jgi:hypothetical protein